MSEFVLLYFLIYMLKEYNSQRNLGLKIWIWFLMC